MLRYVVRRLLQSIIVVFGVSIVAFGMNFLTGDPTEVILGDRADQMSV
jgi:peptide/nickel transport system permease protein